MRAAPVSLRGLFRAAPNRLRALVRASPVHKRGEEKRRPGWARDKDRRVFRRRSRLQRDPLLEARWPDTAGPRRCRAVARASAYRFLGTVDENFDNHGVIKEAVLRDPSGAGLFIRLPGAHRKQTPIWNRRRQANTGVELNEEALPMWPGASVKRAGKLAAHTESQYFVVGNLGREPRFEELLRSARAGASRRPIGWLPAPPTSANPPPTDE